MASDKPKDGLPGTRASDGPLMGTFASLRGRDFRFLWCSNLFFYMVQWLELLTLGWLVWELTKDPDTGEGNALFSSTAAGLRAIPTLLLGPWAGVVTDRMDRRKLVIAVQLLLVMPALLFGLLVASGHAEVWHVFLYAGIAAVGNAMMMPARMSLVVNTVPRGNLRNAIGLDSVSVTANRITGALIGGLLITTVGIKWNFFVEAGAYVAMSLLMIPMKTPYREESTAHRSSVFTNFIDGVQYLWNENRIILHLMGLNLILAMVFIPLLALLPAYTGEALNAAADVGGYLMAAQGVGGLTVSLVIASVGFGIRKGQVSVITLVVGSAAILTLAQSQWLLLSLGMMLLMGVCQSSFITANTVLVQSMISDTMGGRITSLYMLEQGLGPIAVVLMALFMELFSARRAMTVEASVSLGLALYFLLMFRQVRQLD